MSGDDEPSGYQTASTNEAPWEPQQEYLKTGFARAQSDVLDKPQQFYPNSTVVPFSGQTEQGLQMQEARALAGSPVTGAAQTQMQDTLQGSYLDAGNPYFQQAVAAATRPMTESFQQDILPGIASSFSGSGRYGSGAQANMTNRAASELSRNIGDVSGSMAAAMYNQERNRQMLAGQLAPGLAQMDYADIGQLKQAGQEREGMAGAELQDQISRFNQEQQAPKDALANYMALIKGGYGTQGSKISPIYRNKPAEYVGLGATVAGAAGSLFGGGGLWGEKGIFGK
jgi:hypothetical protein